MSDAPAGRGPRLTPRPGPLDLREWDRLLLGRYRPVHHPTGADCTACALGPCDLTRKRGACGQDLIQHTARQTLAMAATGAAAHVAHARDVVETVITEHGADLPLDPGPWVRIRTPIIELVVGSRPRKVSELVDVLGYLETQLVRLVAATHFGGECAPFDLESKTLHAGTMDLVALEVADVAQAAGYRFPSGIADTPLVPLGLGRLDTAKPVILCLGHHSAVGHRIAALLEERGLTGEIELAGLCCTAHDIARGHPAGITIVGNQRDQLSFVRAGVADVVVADQQCIRLDLRDETLDSGAVFLATSEVACAGLPAETVDDEEALADEVVARPRAGAFVADVDGAARLAVALARRGKRARPSVLARDDDAAGCTRCGDCDPPCPVNLPVAEATGALAWDNTWGPLQELAEVCIRCGRCDDACPVGLPVMALIDAADEAPPVRSLVRAGRGPITDFEIKATGPSVVMGDIPGVVAFLACPDYPDGRESPAWMARILAERGYIVLTAGCAALDLAWPGIGGPNPYEAFPGVFDQGGLVNTGSCVSASHAVGAAIKIAAIFLQRRLAGNYTAIADYILNRLGVVGVLWGGITPKALASAAGANRLGIPVLFGPHGKRFGRTLEAAGSPDAGPFTVLDARTGRRVTTGAAPAGLCVTAADKQEAVIEIARLCLRANDTAAGRQVKLRHYFELSSAVAGHLPPDIGAWLRSPYDVPPGWEDAAAAAMAAPDWRPSPIPDPTLLQELIRPGIDVR